MKTKGLALRLEKLGMTSREIKEETSRVSNQLNAIPEYSTRKTQRRVYDILCPIYS